MLKIAGVILCIAGSAGFGILNIAGWNRAKRELDEWILLLEGIKNHIQYKRDVIAKVFCTLDKSIYGTGGTYVAAVGREMINDRTKTLKQAWREHMLAWKQDSYLPKELKKEILTLPEYMGEQECGLQIQRIDFFLHDLYAKKEVMEKELEVKKKPVMAISLVGGITVSILLI